MKKSKLFTLIILAIMLMNLGCSQNQEHAYLKDAYDLISVVENTHPAFLLDEVPDNYKKGKQEFIDSITMDTSRDEFIFLIRKYLTVLQDGHTNVESYSANTRFLDVNCQTVGEKLFLVNRDEILSNAYITHIGGVPIDQIFKNCTSLFCS